MLRFCRSRKRPVIAGDRRGPGMIWLSTFGKAPSTLLSDEPGEHLQSPSHPRSLANVGRTDRPQRMAQGKTRGDSSTQFPPRSLTCIHFLRTAITTVEFGSWRAHHLNGAYRNGSAQSARSSYWIKEQSRRLSARRQTTNSGSYALCPLPAGCALAEILQTRSTVAKPLAISCIGGPGARMGRRRQITRQSKWLEGHPGIGKSAGKPRYVM